MRTELVDDKLGDENCLLNRLSSDEDREKSRPDFMEPTRIRGKRKSLIHNGAPEQSNAESELIQSLQPAFNKQDSDSSSTKEFSKRTRAESKLVQSPQTSSYKQDKDEDENIDRHDNKCIRAIFEPDKGELSLLRLSWYTDEMSNNDIVWNKNYDCLLEYRRIHKHCNVPFHLKCQMPDGQVTRIGLWLYNQRQLKSKGLLKIERAAVLQSLVDRGELSWYLGPTDDDKWNTMFHALLTYGESNNGNCCVPNPYVTTLADGSTVKLGVWLTKQRQLKRKNKLRPDRLARLEELVNSEQLSW